MSDHVPIWIKFNITNWGPKPFKLFEARLGHPQFMSFVSRAWQSNIIGGKETYVLKDNLKHLKGKLRIWNMETFKYLGLKVEKAVLKLNLLDLKVGEVSHSGAADKAQASSRVWNQCILRRVSYSKNPRRIGLEREIQIQGYFIRP